MLVADLRITLAEFLEDPGLLLHGNACTCIAHMDPNMARIRRKLRLKGRGLPSKEPGDLYLELEPAIPGAVTPEQRAAWEALAKAYPGFDPRVA